MSNKPSEDSSRRNFLTAAVIASAAVAAPTIATAQGVNPQKAKAQKRGIYREDTNDNKDKIADYSYTSDVLAQLIVDMWLGKHDNLLKAPTVGDYTARSTNAKAALAERGIILEKPIVITEQEYVAGFRLADAGLTDGSGENIGVVFVLPRSDRAMASMPSSGDPPPLLESAKLLMSITPNGI